MSVLLLNRESPLWGVRMNESGVSEWRRGILEHTINLLLSGVICRNSEFSRLSLSGAEERVLVFIHTENESLFTLHVK